MRNFGILPIGVNVIENCFRVCNIPLEENNLHINEWDSFKDVYRRFCEFYLKRELEFDEEAIQRILKPIKWTSFRNFRYNIKILRDVFGFGFQEVSINELIFFCNSKSILVLVYSEKISSACGPGKYTFITQIIQWREYEKRSKGESQISSSPSRNRFKKSSNITGNFFNFIAVRVKHE